MRNTLILTLLAIVSFAKAEPMTQPSTQPSESLPTVLVMKFEQIDQTPGLLWLSRSIQQSLVTDINRARFARAASLPEARSTPTTDTSVALSLGREQRVDFVIVGAYQTWDDQLRITAQVLDVSKGEVIGGLKLTGGIQGLYLLQDGMISQLRSLVAPKSSRLINVPAALLEIKNAAPIGRVSTINSYEVIRPQAWQASAANRNTYLGSSSLYGCWGYWGYFNGGFWGVPFWY